VHPPPSPARADFSIMMECTPEIGNRHNECTLRSNLGPAQIIYFPPLNLSDFTSLQEYLDCVRDGLDLPGDGGRPGGLV
jgi:hypothetical protein